MKYLIVPKNIHSQIEVEYNCEKQEQIVEKIIFDIDFSNPYFSHFISEINKKFHLLIDEYEDEVIYYDKLNDINTYMELNIMNNHIYNIYPIIVFKHMVETAIDNKTNLYIYF